MNPVTIGLASVDETRQRMPRAFEGTAQGAFISFPTIDLLWKVLTAKRWDILRAMTGAGPLSIREVARRVGRDVKTVHGDGHALLKAGVLERAEDGRIIFPYEPRPCGFLPPVRLTNSRDLTPQPSPPPAGTTSPAASRR